MPRLPGVGQKDAERVLAKVGFEVIRQGKHVVMSDGVRIVTIPRQTPINQFTMGAIAKGAGLTPQEFKKLL